ncbi:MAG: DUF4293 domain-containing protein [Bacteroidales bacterium]|nr:DUF4293 domain-containing protein [Bacteroidales bacterium]
MIQRSQSLYLLIVFILSILLYTGPLAFIGTADGGYFLQHTGVFDLSGEKIDVSTWPLTAMISISAFLSFFTIFSYMKRQRQMRLTLFQMFFNLGLIAVAYYYVRYVMHNYEGIQFVIQWRAVIPPIMLVLLIMAFRGIRRDELLIKAYDRLR